jgi:hypothetical protein
MRFFDDAHQQGVLRQAGPVYQFRHIELQHKLARTSAKIGFEYDVQDVNGNRYQVALVNVFDPAIGADENLVPDSGNRFVRAVFKITMPFGELKGEDVKRAAAIGSDGRIYPADINNTVGYAGFDNGSIQAARLGTPVTGAVIFQVPDGIKVLKIEWATSGQGSAVQWVARRYEFLWSWLLCPASACRSRACPFAFYPPCVNGQLAALADEPVYQLVKLTEASDAVSCHGRVTNELFYKALRPRPQQAADPGDATRPHVIDVSRLPLSAVASSLTRTISRAQSRVIWSVASGTGRIGLGRQRPLSSYPGRFLTG